MIKIIAILIACVLLRHLGLADFITKKIHIPIIGCTKCLVFWSTLSYMLSNKYNVIITISISFVCAYIALWLELLFNLLTIIYDKGYGKIYIAEADANKDTEADKMP